MVVGNQGQNVYPAPDNYPVTSFPQEVPAPDAEPDDAGTLISVQYSWTWREVLLAAVDQLLNPATWQGDHDAKRLAVDRAITLKGLLAVGTVGTPFWDDATDIDDQAPDDQQTWYGYVTDPEAAPADLTFVENALLWGFTGLFAVGLSPGFAIAFNTIARKFVIAQKAGDVGEVIRIVVDAEEVARVDTTGHAGEIIRTPVIAPGGGSTHQIYIVKAS